MHDFTREEILSVLAGLGIELPPATKLPHEALQKRLKQSLLAAQSFFNVLPAPPVDPKSLTEWPLPEHEPDNTVLEAIKRSNLAEISANIQAMRRGEHVAPEIFVNPVSDLRQTLMGIASVWDKGLRWCVINDLESQVCTISLRILSIHALNSQTPLIVVLYRAFTIADAPAGVEWAQAQLQKSLASTIKATVLEQKLILKLLGLNSKYLSHNYAPGKTPLETDFTPSFFLPVGPLGFADIGKLNADTGCFLCGKKAASRCSQCQSVSYCGPECQHADWPNHKHTCRSLKGGSWRTIPFTRVMPGHEGSYSAYLNRFHSATNFGSVRDPANDSIPPPNIHGDKVFLVKLQLGVSSGMPNMMIYDRQQSFNDSVFFVKDVNPQLFEEVQAEMSGPRSGYRGLKMYRFAKRLSDWELSICLDRKPQGEIKW
ncbi:hypothetical protein POSPLADRAFT_1158823 [Postia placenta MAD-698-R-SB12]|uniref:MYND-type domain-containing protein n=1 Tax=Postia placenta MAD-698-R-SB12 TaxID=670580 RepID=A0A1X6MKM0_9APHY|nr:hypothetical protein POSPLADRAFT_1158823 [Postia placenta MAD-698-R-SB12]OSX56732.1 hypothetical protein POSPLADRAFT_1158823 [Postia placenta MAD-698-R-SB12]